MRARRGFTLVEVLIAASILMFALVGIGAMGLNAYRKSNLPDNVEKASILAAERMSYFRAQRNPYLAVGGTYYQPPASRFLSDLNLPGSGANVNNVVNGANYLFVREYLYDTSEGRGKNDDDGDQGRSAARSRFDPTAAEQINLVPATPTTGEFDGNPVTQEGISAVLPNPGQAPDTGLTPGPNQQPTGYGRFYSIVAPRANDSLGDGDPLPAAVKFVREVWIQTNHPGFRPVQEVWFGGIVPTTLQQLGNMQNHRPIVIPNLPPFTIGVTVRVFARDALTRELQIDNAEPGTAPPEDGIRHNGAPPRGVGFDRRRPLAEISSIFSLRRSLQE